MLGPLAATSGETRVELGGKRQRLVLAVLLAHANHVITQDALVDAVWNGALPESGARSLHTYVSHLRKVLHGDIERDGGGYVLKVNPRWVDALRFEALIAEARAKLEEDASEAASLLRQGLGLWTGSAYGDLGHEPALFAEMNRLAEARVAALELRFEVDLLLGRHEEIVPEIEALLREEPFREHLAGMLMLSLYRSGRQAEALRVYRGMRERLVEELGIDPGNDLQDLELKILDGDPALRAPWAGMRTTTRGEVHGARGYEIHEKIGTTEFGDRFRGFHGTMGREVSVLVIEAPLANSPKLVRRFEAEMQAVSRLEHPHLAPAFDYWRDPNAAYVITPFYRGGTLESTISDRPLTLAGAVRLADQLSAALGFLHRQGYAHGAISLASVFLDQELNAYLTDTGLANVARPVPEVEAANDVYQLGALVYQVLTLRRPDGATNVSEWRVDLPSEIEHAVSRALHPEPALRYHRIEEFARALRQSAGLDVMAVPGEGVHEVERRNPYKGLRAFQEADAPDFHGRDALIEEMLEALTSSRFVAVVGPSGSGKSSAVRAGLVPQLRKGAVPSSQHWLITDMFPGDHPFETLESALLRVATTRPPDLYETLTADVEGLSRIVDQLASPGSEILLVIDQFEELFSMVTSASDRQLFLDALAAASDQDSRLRIVLTLRADFFDQPLRYPEFADIFRSNVVAVSPPTRDGLTRAISQPALGVGLSLEPGLVTRIVDDVREQPGGLPLLQFALSELFASREGEILTLDAYHASGGVGGALAKRAEETYSTLSSPAKEAARQLFLRLVTVDELADDTRRRVRQSELLGLDIDRTVMSDTMHQFGALRFVSFDRDAASRAPTVELAHEALLHEWSRLETWIDERREDLLIHRRIQITVQDWRESGGDHSYQLRGSRLEQALAWVDRTDIAISTEEMALIEASVETEKRELADRLALEGKAARRRKAVIGVLAGGLVTAGVLGAVALERAQDARRSAAEATARDLSTAAIAAIDEDPELGILLSLQAIAATDSVGMDIVPEAASALRTTLANTRLESRIPTGFDAVAFSGDGNRVATDDKADPSMLHLWDTASNRSIAQWAGSDENDFPEGEVSQLRFSPDDGPVAATWVSPGHVLGTGRLDAEPADAESMVAFTLHDPETLELEGRLIGEPGSYWAPSFGAEGLVAASFAGASTFGRAYLWDRDTGEVVDVFDSSHGILGAELVPGTTTLVLAHGAGLDGTGAIVEPGRLQALDVTTSEELWVLPALGINPDFMVLSPDGSKAAISDVALHQVEIWDLETQMLLKGRPHADPQAMTWSSDGSRLAISGNDANITILDEEQGWEPGLTLTGQTASVWATAFEPSGRTLASASAEGGVVMSNVTEAGAVGDDAMALGSPVGLIFLGPEGRLIAGTAESGGLTVDLATGDVVATLPIGDMYDLSPNDGFTTVAGQRGIGPRLHTGLLVNALTGEVTRTFPSCLLARAVSFDDRFVVLDSMLSCDEKATPEPSQIRDLKSNQVVVDLGKRIAFKAVFSPAAFDGPRFAAVNSDDAVEIYTLDSGELVTSYSMADFGVTGFLVLSLDPQGKYLGIGTSGPNAIVVDMMSIMSGVPKMDAVVFNEQAHKGNTPQVRVTSDGVAATASFDGIYRVWDIATDEMLFEVKVDLAELGAVQFTPDGSQLAYEDANGVIRFTPLDTREVIERARTTVTRALTDDECRRFLHTDGCTSGGG